MSDSGAPNPPHLENLLRRFSSLAIGATFLAGTQAQVLSVSIGIPTDEETAAIRATNALFLSGLILDLMAAFLSYLTSRWLQQLSMEEKAQLEKLFDKHQSSVPEKGPDIENGDGDAPNSPHSMADWHHSADAHAKTLHWNDKLVEICFSTSLLISMPMLAIGSLCMLIGLIVYTWSQHPTVVAVIVTAVFGVNLPFLAGVILISRKSSRRRAIIHRLSTMQGTW